MVNWAIKTRLSSPATPLDTRLVVNQLPPKKLLSSRFPPASKSAAQVSPSAVAKVTSCTLSSPAAGA